MRTLRLLGFLYGVVVTSLACATSPGGGPPGTNEPDAAARASEDAAAMPPPPSADAADVGPPEDLGPGGAFRAYADQAAAGLRDLYDVDTGLFPSTGWWNSANAITALVAYSARTGSTAYVDDIARTFDKSSGGSFLNEYYDDEGWWALAWIDAYDLTKDARYLAMAKTIFADITGAWDATCGGGVWWKKDRKYKNAITNELFLQIAVRLHQRTPGDAGPGSFIDWATREWAWFDKSGMINADNLVNDGLKDCKNNGETTWTYNQGVLVGGLVELAKETGDTTLVDRAQAIASAAFAKLVDDQGVLREPCEPSCGADGPQFKGIFMRNVARLAEASAEPANRRFIANSADWAWNAARAGTGAATRLGLQWSQPFDSGDAARQASALDLLNAAIPLDAPQVNLALAKTASSNGACTAEEGASRAVDGKVSTKWCAGDTGGSYWLEVDLGESTPVGRVILRHAGAGGEKVDWNTKDFKLRASADHEAWADLATVTGNKRSVTIHRVVPAAPARYVRLEITAPQSDPALVAARIDEIEIYAR